MRSSVFCWLLPFVRMPNVPAVSLYVVSSRVRSDKAVTLLSSWSLAAASYCCSCIATGDKRKSRRLMSCFLLPAAVEQSRARQPFHRNMSHGCALNDSTVCLFSLQPAAQHHPVAHCSVPEPGDVPRRCGQWQQRDADPGRRPGHAGWCHAEPQHTGNHQPCQGALILKQPIILRNRACFAPQGPTFPAMLGDSGLSGQTSSGQQVILVSHHSQSDTRAPDNGFGVSVFISSAVEGRWMVCSNCGIFVCASRSLTMAIREGRTAN